MAKDKAKKVRGSWWYGWVRYTYTDYNGTERDGRRITDWEFATAGQAKREADALAGAMEAPRPVERWQRKHWSKTDPSRKSRITVVETGASRVE